MTILEERFMESVARAANKYNNKKIDWEQRTFDVAKALFANADLQTTSVSSAISFAISDAQAFIKEYKEKVKDC